MNNSKVYITNNRGEHFEALYSSMSLQYRRTPIWTLGTVEPFYVNDRTYDLNICLWADRCFITSFSKNFHEFDIRYAVATRYGDWGHTDLMLRSFETDISYSYDGEEPVTTMNLWFQGLAKLADAPAIVEEEHDIEDECCDEIYVDWQESDDDM